MPGIERLADALGDECRTRAADSFTTSRSRTSIAKILPSVLSEVDPNARRGPSELP